LSVLDAQSDNVGSLALLFRRVALTIQVSSQTVALARPNSLGPDTGRRPLLVLWLFLLPLSGAMERLDEEKARRFCWTLLLMLGCATCLVGAEEALMATAPPQHSIPTPELQHHRD
jgi:hypothetical protein